MRTFLNLNNLINSRRKQRINVNQEKVENVSISINNTCFFKCKMCHMWKNKSQEKLDFKVYLKLFSDLKAITTEKTMVSFTGGETLANPAVFDIIYEAHKSGFRTHINTNGWLLTKTNIEKVLKSGINKISISLDGSCPEVHDSIRGMPGSYTRIIRAADYIKNLAARRKFNVDVGVHTVISALNLEDIENLVSLVEKKEFFDTIRFQAVAAPLGEITIQDNKIESSDKSNKPFWYDSEEFGYLWPRNKTILQRVYTNLICLTEQENKLTDRKDRLTQQYLYFINPEKRMEGRVCTVFKDLQINVDGSVSHCTMKNQILGNIKTDSIINIWTSPEALESRKKIINCNINCHQLINCNISSEEFFN